MESGDFHYNKDQWDKIVEIVERAGGVGKRETLEAKRVTLEKLIVVWKRSFDTTENKAREKDLQAKALARRQKQIAPESAKLNAVLSNLKKFMLDDPVLEPVAKKLEPVAKELAKISSTLDLEQQRRGRGRPENKHRKLLFKRVGEFWKEDLGLEWTPSESPMTRFIAAACCNVCKTTSSAVSQALIGGLKSDLEWVAKVMIGGVKIIGEDKQNLYQYRNRSSKI
jgi:hypothetical protein